MKKLPKAKIVTLFITHSCNLNCTYCFEKHKDNKTMPLELAQKIILDEILQIKKSSINDAIKIDLFGGEPLLNFSFIKDFTEWAAQNVDIPYIIYATTNGTLLDDCKKEWFRKHKDEIVLVMSVDGDSAMQLKNRGCDSAELPLEFVAELWEEQPFKMTISKSSLNTLADGVLSLLKKGYLVEGRLAQGENWTKEDAVIYKEQLEKMAQFYLNDYQPNGLFTKLYPDILRNEKVPHKCCGTGTNMIAYDVDGSTFPCHIFSPIVLGENKSEELKKINFYNNEDLIEKSCLKCVMVNMCSTCIGYNYYKRGDVKKRDKSMCCMMLAEAKIISAFQINYYMKKSENLTDDELVRLDSSIKVYEKLKNVEFDDILSIK
ncbi:MAG: 4Fe-4S cluster-binding domain-containing protein [Prevotellaceae bacterium]|jgi:radical SAM protein with 4Fe4S-binding SPASM domain|nr:4Fe-4S cluster-binding domain-containing protein [Prevotellaceae bacterium]